MRHMREEVKEFNDVQFPLVPAATTVKSLIEQTKTGSSLIFSVAGTSENRMMNLLRLSVRSNISPSKTYLNHTLHASVLE